MKLTAKELADQILKFIALPPEDYTDGDVVDLISGLIKEQGYDEDSV